MELISEGYYREITVHHRVTSLPPFEAWRYSEKDSNIFKDNSMVRTHKCFCTSISYQISRGAGGEKSAINVHLH